VDTQVTPRARWFIAVVPLALIAILLYGTDLGRRPLDPEEVILSSQFAMVAAHGWHDTDGRFLPLFVHAGGNAWLPPGQAYATAAVAWVSSSLSSVRWVPVCAGALDVALMFLLATRMSLSVTMGFTAASLLLFTPAHAQFSRSAVADGVWPLPFILVWLLGLVVFCDPSSAFRRLALAIGAVALAAIAYVEPSSPLMVPVFAALGLVVLYEAGRLRWREILPASMVFAITLAPLALWFLTHQSTYPDTFGRWVLHLAHVRNPLEWWRAATSSLTVSTVSGTYWDFFSPEYLFIDGTAAASAGVFLFPVALLLLVGGWTIVKDRMDGRPRRPLDLLVLVGFICAPLGAATFKEARVTGRALVIVLFGVLLATRGLETLQSHRTTPRRVLAALLLVAVAFQFVFWYRDLLRVH
jgi:hypothetical protein